MFFYIQIITNNQQNYLKLLIIIMVNQNLTCPIRGTLKNKTFAKDGLTFTEEYQRIQCINFLLSKSYPKQCFKFENIVWKLGNNARNNLRADIVIVDENDNNKIILVAEIKRENKDKNNAINNQLIPALIKTNAKFGIYFDGIENALFCDFDNYKTEYNLNNLPIFGFNFQQRSLTFADLKPIENITAILERLEQILHNIGTTKEEKYNRLFALILCKYFDEKQCEDDNKKILTFQLTNHNLSKKLNELYSQAKLYYSNQNLVENLNFNEETLISIIKLLQNYTFLNSKQDILQTLFMKFASSTLKTELSQFYTPISIVEFIISLLNIENMSKIIDPAGGSADFLVGAIKANRKCATNDNVYYWDCSKNAVEVAKLNMIINGDGKSHIYEKDSIENYNDNNSEFDFVITNPPFGDKTRFTGNKNILNNYALYKQGDYTQLGILFVERSLNLLKENGILAIILPHGYLTNPNDKILRKYIINNSQILAYISLPEGAFKGSNTGVKSGILLLKKDSNITTENVNYKIFMATVNNLGFDYNSKNLTPLFMRNQDNGEYILDNNNQRILLNDFPSITEKFKTFIYDLADNKLQLNKIENESQRVNYNYVLKSKLFNEKENKNLIINPELFEEKYLKCIEKIQKNKFSNLKNFDISNKKESDFIIEKSALYTYIDISNLSHGDYSIKNKLRGWELPNRAKVSVQENDIIISKLKGSFEKFAMIINTNNTENLIATNGCFRIRINDENIRLSFYHFLFTNDFLIQAEALATGSIMLDLKLDDIKNKIYFPILENDELVKMKTFVEVQKQIKSII